MGRTYLLIGGNIGNRLQNLQRAITLIGTKAGEITRQSAVYETEAWGKHDQPAFLNQVLRVITSQQPQALLQTLLGIEQEMGRARQEKYGPRTIDIDILLYDDLVMKTDELAIPHPQLHLRRFALAPLAEIAASVIHPVLKKSIDELLLECPDKLAVKKL
ncbi:MAG TPA: 2-amino-4-hydroxy-6-hydroxymethyldihydropteridine diphosphokinase [Chitinophagaceae bacterium]|nr:2-amino-4-hydroxy-6-hydroxymethyldihydropteridine diphosphokinase [Chitinophagaceae bacterium]